MLGNLFLALVAWVAAQGMAPLQWTELCCVLACTTFHFLQTFRPYFVDVNAVIVNDLEEVGNLLGTILNQLQMSKEKLAESGFGSRASDITN